MTDTETTDISTIDKKMNVIIGLLSKMVNGEKQTAKERITELSEYGLSSVQIAEMMGKTTQYVSNELSKIKAAKNKK